MNGRDDLFMIAADPCPDLKTAVRMSWFTLGKFQADYGLLYFELSEDLLTDNGVWSFNPRYRITAPNLDYGSITLL